MKEKIHGGLCKSPCSLVSIYPFQRIYCKYCVHMYVKGKIIPVKTVPRMRGQG
jgi:hypothetical protein